MANFNAKHNVNLDDHPDKIILIEDDDVLEEEDDNEALEAENDNDLWSIIDEESTKSNEFENDINYQLNKTQKMLNYMQAIIDKNTEVADRDVNDKEDNDVDMEDKDLNENAEIEIIEDKNENDADDKEDDDVIVVDMEDKVEDENAEDEIIKDKKENNADATDKENNDVLVVDMEDKEEDDNAEVEIIKDKEEIDADVNDKKDDDVHADEGKREIDTEVQIDAQAVLQEADTTTLLDNKDESFALAPVKASALKGQRQQRKRKLIVDETNKAMKAQMSDSSNIVKRGRKRKVLESPKKAIATPQEEFLERDSQIHKGVKEVKVVDKEEIDNPVKRGRKRKMSETTKNAANLKRQKALAKPQEEGDSQIHKGVKEVKVVDKEANEIVDNKNDDETIAIDEITLHQKRIRKEKCFRHSTNTVQKYMIQSTEIQQEYEEKIKSMNREKEKNIHQIETAEKEIKIKNDIGGGLFSTGEVAASRGFHLYKMNKIKLIEETYSNNKNSIEKEMGKKLNDLRKDFIQFSQKVLSQLEQ